MTDDKKKDRPAYVFLDSRTGIVYDSEEEAIADIAERVIKKAVRDAAKEYRNKGIKIPHRPWESLSPGTLAFKKMKENHETGTVIGSMRITEAWQMLKGMQLRIYIWYRAKLLRQVKEIERRIYDL